MKKMFLMLAVLLLVSAAYASVDIGCTRTPDTNEITVTYVASAPSEKPRGIALDISLSNGYTISKVAKLTDNKYWVYPGTIDVEGAQYNGSPEVGNVIGASSMTIEMGSLHSPTGYDANSTIAPAQSGNIIKFYIKPTSGTDTGTITISGNAARGNVVKYDATEATVNYSTCTYTGAPPECFPSGHPHYTEWVTVGKPSSWCYPKQCHGDANGSREQFGRNNYVTVGSQDVTILLQGYNKNTYTDPVTHPWIAADFNHSREQFGRNNYVRVGSQDVTILLQYYNDNESTVPADCLNVP